MLITAIHVAACECRIIRCSSLDVRTLAASVCFCFCKRTTCCSIVLCMTNRTTRTRRSCPIRYARRTACSSSVGFQPGSRITTVDAVVKLRPRPPALVEIRKISAVGSVRKRCTSASRAVPMSLCQQPSSRAVLTHCELKSTHGTNA